MWQYAGGSPPVPMHRTAAAGGESMTTEPTAPKVTTARVKTSEAITPPETLKADRVEISQGGADHVEATSVSINQGGIGTAAATNIDVHQGGIQRATATDI